MNTTIARYLLGVGALAVICGSLGLAALTLRRRVLPDWAGAPARLAEVVTGLALLVAILELLGLVGLFALAPIVLACALAGAVSIRAAPAPHRPRRRAAPVLGAGTGTLVALLGGAIVIAEWGALTIQSYDAGIRGFDSLWYHLPWAASFAQTGAVAPLRFTDVEYLTPFYPATAELLHGLGIVLLGRDTLSPGLNLVWLGLVLLAAYCIGRPRGAGAATLLGAALAMATTMMDYSQAGSAANDVVAVFFLLAAVALLVNADAPRERPGPLILAAIAAGLAAGTKLTVLAPVLALTIGVIAITPRRTRVATAGLWLGPLLVAGGFWYARNLIAVGNPLPWTSLGGILPTPAPALQQHTGYSVAHYLADPHFWSRFAQPALAAGLGRWWWLVLGAAIIGPLLCLAWPKADRRIRMLGAVALFSLAAYLITPETAAGPNGDPVGFAFNLRYLAPALALSLTVLPLAPPLNAKPAARTVTVAGFAAVLAGTVAQPRLWPSAHAAGAVAIGLATLAGVALVALTRARLAIVAAAILALVIAGYPVQAHYVRGRYAYQPDVSYLASVWALFRTIHHARVGVVGTFGGFFSYPLYGVDVSNRVQYVGEPGPHGSFTPIGTCARWRARLNTAHLDYIIITPARDPWHPRQLTASPENAWTASDAAAQPFYRALASGQPIVVYRIRGQFDPEGCG